MVLVNVSDNDEAVYGVQYFHTLHGKKYAFGLSSTQRDRGGKRYMPGQESIIIGPVLKVVRKEEGKKEEKKAAGNLKSYEACFEDSLFGIHYGDEVTVKEDGQAKPGQLILVKPDDGIYEESFFTRCCLVKEDHVRVCSNTGELTTSPLRR
jgi:hypothetical protein